METKIRILYVEDDATLLFVTRDNLELRGYEVDCCGDGVTALDKAMKHHYHICILDVMLPKMDGFSLAKKIREKDPDIPILFLTARSEKEDKIYGLQLGADDYITKPFSIEELVLKIGIFLKRPKITPERPGKNQVFPLGLFHFDPSNQVIYHGKAKNSLTYRESEILRFFVENRNKVIKREEILIQIWGNDHFFSSRSLDVFISRLRKILKKDPSLLIENIHNVGYRLKVPEEMTSP
jgi:two-component system, OmpR family, response regulator VicR